MKCRASRSDGSKTRLVVPTLGCISLTCAILAASTAIAADVQSSARSPVRIKAVETTVSKPADDAKKDRGIHAAPAGALRSVRTEAAIQEALEATADLDFTKTPLDDIMGAIGDFTKINIVLDKKALADMSIACDLPMTVSLRGISVRSALDVILRDINLTWAVIDEAILITTPEEADKRLVTHVYDVSDLVSPCPSYPFDGMYIPEARGGRIKSGTAMAGAFGLGGSRGGLGSVAIGGMAGMLAKTDKTTGSGPGGALVAVVEPSQRSEGNEPAASTASPQDFDSLVNLITATIAPDTWDENGGPGSIQPLEGPPGMLVVSQTQAVHQETEKLLGQIRAVKSKAPLVTVRALWLLLDMKQLDDLLGSKSGKDGGVDGKALREMADKVNGYAGTITCFSGQTVHIASGHSRSAIVGAIPIVGSGIGYQPVVSNPDCGAILQVTPQVMPGAKTAVVDLWSSVVRPGGPSEQFRFLSGKPASEKGEKNEDAAALSVTLDRVNLAVEQLGTAMRLPLGEATLVGGLTREPSSDQLHAAAAPQLYLFIEVTAK